MFKPKFKYGQIIMTRGADATLDIYDVVMGLHRHTSGDWGEVSEQSKELNEESLQGGGGNIMSAYTDRNGVKFWIITEHDRSATTILLPEDY